jgi:hypothetical protein
MTLMPEENRRAVHNGTRGVSFDEKLSTLRAVDFKGPVALFVDVVVVLGAHHGLKV